jgi:hypothetical protein
MLHLTGRLADGWIGSTFSMLPEHVPALQQAIDQTSPRLVYKSRQ